MSRGTPPVAGHSSATVSRKLPHRPRVFCIGWHKTGTSTLGYALHYLGYRVLGARLDTVGLLEEGRIPKVVGIAEPFDAVQDVPWAALFRELDHAYPGSRFILTYRDEDAWLASAARHFKDEHIPLHQWLYGKGRLIGNESVYLARYRRHNAEVRDYFAQRPARFLEVNFANGDGWEKLCEFLDCEIPPRAFPRANQAAQNQHWHKRVSNAVKGRLPGPIRTGLFAIKLRVLRPFGYEDRRNIFHNARENRLEREQRRARPRSGERSR